MIGGMRIEVARTEHVATARLDVGGRDLEVVLGRRGGCNTEEKQGDRANKQAEQDNPGARRHTVPPEAKQ
jgi:hypothetical protein